MEIDSFFECKLPKNMLNHILLKTLKKKMMLKMLHSALRCETHPERVPRMLCSFKHHIHFMPLQILLLPLQHTDRKHTPRSTCTFYHTKRQAHIHEYFRLVHIALHVHPNPHPNRAWWWCVCCVCVLHENILRWKRTTRKTIILLSALA